MAFLSGAAPKELGKWFVDGTVVDPAITGGYTILWDGESHNTFAGASPMNPVTGIFTFPAPGIYRINCQLILDDHVEGDTERYQGNLLVNGTSQIITRFDATSDMNYLPLTLNGVVNVAAAGHTMTVQLFANQDSADISGLSESYTFICVEKLT